MTEQKKRELQELAREILRLFKTMAHTMDNEYEEAKKEFIVNSVVLAQKVIDSDAVKCSFNYTKDELQDLSNGVLSAVEQAKQEQKEKDAEIAINCAKKYTDIAKYHSGRIDMADEIANEIRNG